MEVKFMNKNKSKASRKGKYFERLVAKELAKQLDKPYKSVVVRTPNSGGLQWKGDIQFLDGFPLYVECKFGYNLNLDSIMRGDQKIRYWWTKAKKEAKTENKTPVLIFSQPRFERYVLIDYSMIKGDLSVIPHILTKDGLVIFPLNYFREALIKWNFLKGGAIK